MLEGDPGLFIAHDDGVRTWCNIAVLWEEGGVEIIEMTAKQTDKVGGEEVGERGREAS